MPRTRYRARWLAPIASPPLKDGWVDVDGGVIRAVGAAADADDLTPGVHEVIKATADGSTNPQTMVKIYGGTEHGLPMFPKNPDLEPAIVDWLKAQLLD